VYLCVCVGVWVCGWVELVRGVWGARGKDVVLVRVVCGRVVCGCVKRGKEKCVLTRPPNKLHTWIIKRNSIFDNRQRCIGDSN